MIFNFFTKEVVGIVKKFYVAPIIRMVNTLKEEVVRTSGLQNSAPLNSSCTFYNSHHFFDGSGFSGGNFVQ